MLSATFDVLFASFDVLKILYKSNYKKKLTVHIAKFTVQVERFFPQQNCIFGDFSPPNLQQYISRKCIHKDYSETNAVLISSAMTLNSIISTRHMKIPYIYLRNKCKFTPTYPYIFLKISTLSTYKKYSSIISSSKSEKKTILLLYLVKY